MSEIRLPYPHPGQQAVRNEARRFNWLAAGRRWRKTTLAMAIAVESAVQGRTMLWGAPTFDQVRLGWDETRHGCADYAAFSVQRMTASFPSGGKIIYRSLDNPDNARGHTADGIVIDEIGNVKAEAWYEVLRPMLIDTGGWLWGIGTPNGRNWFHQAFYEAVDGDDSACWQVPTVGCEIVGNELHRKPHPLENPFIPFSEIQDVFQRTPKRIFRQEYLAEFIEGEGAVFRNIKANLWEGGEVGEDHPGHDIVMGVDWGQSVDFTAISIACADCKKELHLDRFHGIGYSLQRARLAQLATAWSVGYILAESNSMGNPNLEDLQLMGLPVEGFETTPSSKPPLIESLALAFEKQEVRWLNDPIATAELEAYERTVNVHTQRPRYSAPEGAHDDTVMARALCLRAITNAGPWAVLI